MQTLGDLFNAALSACGNAADVTDPESQGRSAVFCRLHYPLARRTVFSAFAWPEMTKYQRLAVLAERTPGAVWQDGDPPPGILFAYGLPSDCVIPRYLHDYSRFQLEASAGGWRLCANTAQAILCYTAEQENPAYWSAALFDTVVAELGARLNMAKSGKMNVTQALRQQAYESLLQMSTAAANAQDTYDEGIPLGWANAGFAIPQATRFIYPTTTYRVEGSNG